MGGNPAKVIGDFWELKHKREKTEKIFKNYHDFYTYVSENENNRIESAWNDFESKHMK
ncbi:MAG: hypothetical protein K6A23_07545 [Butyrivibrio sp.]|nr:hypothetical protein [Butyrivibrio sp.]